MLTPVYAHEPFPTQVEKTIFLAGPTPRIELDRFSWRPGALKLLQSMGYDGHVFIPEARNGDWTANYDAQIDWEEEALNRADVIAFWVPRDMTGEAFYGVAMPALTTNTEWGIWMRSGKVVWGAPPEAQKVGYQTFYAKKYNVPYAQTLLGTMALAINRVDHLAEASIAKRVDGECTVPLHIWNNSEFRQWLVSMRVVGNRLDNARVVWTENHMDPSAGMFAFALQTTITEGTQPDIFSSFENRKEEPKLKDTHGLRHTSTVIFRPDIASIVLYRGQEVVLVREFRAAGRNGEGYIWQLPGGSGGSRDMLEVAFKEVQEETGLTIDPARFKWVNGRQTSPTLLANEVYLFSVELTKEEMDAFKADETLHGAEGEDEQIRVVVMGWPDILVDHRIDFGTIGMIASVMSQHAAQ